MKLDEHIQFWDKASIRIMDVRHCVLCHREQLLDHRLPASGFFITAGGKARIRLDGTSYEAQRLHVLHADKGSVIDIQPQEDEFAYYLIYYKAEIPLPSTFQGARKTTEGNPFRMRYGFQPSEPVALYVIVRLMHSRWQQPGRLEKLETKSLFFRFVHEMLRQMQTQNVEMVQPDLLAQAIRYIENHYEQPITLESLAELLACGPQQLLRVFKSRQGNTPIRYLIQTRIERAKELLLDTPATLQEISEGVGYPDSYYFSRLFKKHTGCSPLQFRAGARSSPQRKYNPLADKILSIGFKNFSSYIDIDNRYQYRRKEDLRMSSGSRMSMTAAVVLCFSLLLSACSAVTSTNASSSAPSQQSSATVEASSSPSEASKAMRTITTVDGEIQIPADPQRIVADQYLGSLIALGVTPVGTPGLHKKNPYFTEALKNVEDSGEINGSMEKLIDLEPDLIITGNGEQGRYDEFSKIAPTVTVPYGQLKNAHEELTFFGKLLGKEKEAEAWLNEYDRRIAEAKARVLKVIPADATFSIFELGDKAVWTYGDNFGRGGQPIYQALGFRPPEGVADEIMEKQWAEVSLEALPKYAGDYLVLTSNRITLEEIKADPIWSTLEAVKNDRVYVWKEERSWYYDPIAVLSQTEELADWLTGLQ
jgi:iron complex transport system substrate-binding protein